ncbi:MAG: hypothetical protein WDW38_008448 [Sanguina aurantia]
MKQSRSAHNDSSSNGALGSHAVHHASEGSPIQEISRTSEAPLGFSYASSLNPSNIPQSSPVGGPLSEFCPTSSAVPLITDLPEWEGTSGVWAAASSSEQLAMFFSPTQLGVQFWEGVHTASGLPWWASIPLATVALRVALFPLSLKARAASTHAELLHQSVQQARAAADGLDGSTAKSLGRVKLVRRIYQQLRATHQPPAIKWYITNTLIQVPIFLALTSALRQMSTGMWPGLSTEGLPFYTDLTSPAVFLETMSTPFGSAGAVLPLAITLAYINIVDRSSGGQSPGINTAMKILGIPVYGLSLLQPHATLLFWLTTALLHQTLQRVTSSPGPGRALAMPEMLIRGTAAAGGAAPLSDKARGPCARRTSVMTASDREGVCDRPRQEENPGLARAARVTRLWTVLQWRGAERVPHSRPCVARAARRVRVLASAAAVAALHAPPSPSLLRALALQYSAEGGTAAAAALLTKHGARVMTGSEVSVRAAAQLCGCTTAPERAWPPSSLDGKELTPRNEASSAGNALAMTASEDEQPTEWEQTPVAAREGTPFLSVGPPNHNRCNPPQSFLRIQGLLATKLIHVGGQIASRSDADDPVTERRSMLSCGTLAVVIVMWHPCGCGVQTLVAAREDALHALRLQPGSAPALLAVASCQAGLTNPAHRTSLDIFLNDCAAAEAACNALASTDQRVATLQALVKLLRQVEARLGPRPEGSAEPGADSEARSSLQQQVARLQLSLRG